RGEEINYKRSAVNGPALKNISYPISGFIGATKKNPAANIAAIGFAPRLYHRDRFDAPPVVVQIFDNLQRPQPDLEQIEDMRRQINQRSTAGGPPIERRPAHRPVPHRFVRFKSKRPAEDSKSKRLRYQRSRAVETANQSTSY